MFDENRAANPYQHYTTHNFRPLANRRTEEAAEQHASGRHNSGRKAWKGCVLKIYRYVDLYTLMVCMFAACHCGENGKQCASG
jgi:hypothetical protein